MDRDDLIALLTPEGMRLLDEVGLIDDQHDALRLVSRLRGEGHPARLVAAVLSQVRLRRRAAAKFGPFAQSMLFTEDGLQQATRLRVAAHHAQRFRAIGVDRVADLGCGLGADALALASLGIAVTAVDADEVTAAIATHNLAPFEQVEVRLGLAEDFDLASVQGLWFDPARRVSARGALTQGGTASTRKSSDLRATGPGGSRRLRDPASWSPSLEFCFAAAATHPIGVKLSPAIEHELLPEGAETQWVSVDGELVEAAVWAGGTGREGVARSALVLGTESAELTAAGPSEDAPVGELGEYLYEPDPAIIRAQLIGEVAHRIGARMIAPRIAWMSTDEAASTPFARGFRVREVLPLQAAKLGKQLRARGIGKLEIKKRGVDLDPAAFRERLALRGEEEATLICTRIGQDRRAILADRLEPSRTLPGR